ncbi:hypothetical protein BOA8489_00040 [Boseongicola aestuarii]|uniref:Uncharacterized protein n=1 Tax=Boseongicola aestuarii TaxID=1470561 RepID=A0A238IVD3_9RHOB|nr:hypothetical protein BOA8489_00040 [Boseongicola aestuarii]
MTRNTWCVIMAATHIEKTASQAVAGPVNVIEATGTISNEFCAIE